MNIFSKIFKCFCNHDWAVSEFQVLTDDNTTIYKCVKCDKHKNQ